MRYFLLIYDLLRTGKQKSFYIEINISLYFNGFKLTKEISKRYPTLTITDVPGKYTRQNQNPATQSGTSCCRHRPPCQCTQDGIYVL